MTYRDNDWIVVAASETSSGLAFQRAPGHRPPTWPDPAVPQQIHLDIMVEDPADAGPLGRVPWIMGTQETCHQLLRAVRACQTGEVADDVVVALLGVGGG